MGFGQQEARDTTWGYDMQLAGHEYNSSEYEDTGSTFNTLNPKSYSLNSFIQLLRTVQNMSIFTCPNC